MDDDHAGRLSDAVLSVTAKLMVAGIKENIENLLYPELRSYGRADRDRLLRKASDTPLDMIEWVGILVALIFVVVVTRYSIPGSVLAGRIALALMNFLVAFLLLGITAGPFLVRRKRRGLRSQLN